MGITKNVLGVCVVIIGLTVSSATAFAGAHRSDLPASAEGRDQFLTEGLLSALVASDGDSLLSGTRLGGFDELVPYVLASPDQEDAGSCLYMATTGIAEWWLARLNPRASRAPNGPLDLSARFLMNVAGVEEDEAQLANWRTDSVYLFNKNGRKTLRNVTYPFTKGWYLGEAYSDRLAPSTEGTPGASYGALYNWIDQRPSQIQSTDWVKLPEFERDVLFADPDNNQWNVGIAPDNIVETVKNALRTRKAPVLVIYNQNSYWHAVYVIGYNDEMDNGGCGYTQSFRKRIQTRVDELTRAAAEATDPKVKEAYEIRARRSGEARDKIENAYAAKGGCTSSKGVFYIRDSIYPDPQGPVYDYDPTRKGDEAPYARRIVFKEYDWLRYFANHIAVVYPRKE